MPALAKDCKRTCGQCSAVTHAPTMSPTTTACMDVMDAAACTQIKAVGLCKTGAVAKNCQKTCGVCLRVVGDFPKV